MITTKIRGKYITQYLSRHINQSDTVLDVGCGDGIISQMIQQSTSCQLTGADILDYASADIIFHKQENPNQLEFKTQSFSTALLIDTLHHVEDQKILIDELQRVAFRVIIIEPQPSIFLRLWDPCINYFKHKEMPHPKNFLAINDYKELLDSHYFLEVLPTPRLFPFNYIAITLQPQ